MSARVSLLRAITRLRLLVRFLYNMYTAVELVAAWFPVLQTG